MHICHLLWPFWFGHYMLPKYSVKVFLGILGFTHIIVFVPKQKWNQYVYSFTEYKITPNWSRNQILWKFCINPATSHLAFNMHIKWKREVENRKVLQRDLFWLIFQNSWKYIIETQWRWEGLQNYYQSHLIFVIFLMPTISFLWRLYLCKGRVKKQNQLW